MPPTTIKVKTLILHIGSWKTGTTSIQAFLSKNAEALEKAGVLYPRAGRTQAGKLENAHHALGRMFEAAGGLATAPLLCIFDFINANLHRSGCDTLLLSSETFMGLSRPETLARFFDCENIVILCTLRNQADFLNAMYYTEVCHLKVVDGPMEYLANSDPRRLDYFGTLNRWAAALPQAQIKLSLFEKGYPARDFPLAHLLSQIGVDLALTEADNRIEHPTLPAQATLLLRRLAAAQYSDVDFFRLFELAHKHRALFHPEKYVYAPSVLRDLQARHADSNAALRKSFLDGIEAQPFAPLYLPDDKLWAAAVGDPDEAVRRTLQRILRTAAHPELA